MDIRKICVCGAGTMGSGIAQLSASRGFNTVLFEIKEDVLGRAVNAIQKNLQNQLEKKKITAKGKEEILDRIEFTSNISRCSANVVIEAIVENAGMKTSLFNQLAEINNRETIFATNTSSLSINEIAAKVTNPERVVGMHFFNPAPVMKLVEVVKGHRTSDEVVRSIVELSQRLHKTPVVCNDSPGFIVNRVARPYYLESLRMAEEDEIDFKTIDELLEATGFKLGPFKLMDLIGNDINYAVSCSLYERLNRPERLRPSSIQKQKVEKGELGMKTGHGYYVYNHPA